MRAKRSTFAIAGTTALALLLSACGGGDDKADTNGDSAKAEYNAAVSKVVNASDKKGGTLKLVNSSDADSYDPARGYYAWVWNFNRFYTRTLVGYKAAVGDEGTKLANDLASSQEVSADGLTYTYKLKDNIKFEDGSPITSKDIKYGVERVFAQDVLSGGPTYLIDFLDQGQNYPGPYKDTDPAKMGLKSVETPDDKTIVFKLKEPFADFPYLLAMPGAGPVPQAKDTGDKYGSKPVASGPYKFESYEPGKKVVLVRNTNWDQSTDEIRKALVDKVELDLGLDPNEIDNRLMSGTADADTGQTGVQTAAQGKILTDQKLKANADAPNTGFIRYVAINNKVAPFDNVECRKAVHYAADKTAMQTARGGPIAGGDIGVNMLPPNINGHDANLDPYNTKSGAPQPDKAKEALAKCGKPNGFDTIIAVRNRGKEPDSAVALQEALKKVGINAKLQKYEASIYYKSVVGSPDNVHKQKFGIIFSGWGADWQTGYGYLQVLVDGRKIQANGNNNLAEINDPAIDSLIDQARKESDPDKAGQVWNQINTKVMENGGLMPFVYDKALNYRNPRLTNVFVNGAFGMIDFQALGVSDGK